MHKKEINFGLSGREREVLGQALVWSKDHFERIPTGVVIGGHGFDKTMRQAGMSAIVSSRESHPVFLPVLTSMVMDVGRATSDPRSRNYLHGQLSREIIEDTLLGQLDILTAQERILLADAVEDHSKLNEYIRRSYVVEVAMDADRLDCLGALGPLRSASWLYNLPLILPEEVDRTSVDGQLKTMYQDMAVRHMEWVDMLWTPSAKEVARPRVQAYRKYLKELQSEASPAYEAFNHLMVSPSSFGVTEVQQQALQQIFAQIKDGGEYGFDRAMRQAGMAVVISSGEGNSVFLSVLTSIVMDAGAALSFRLPDILTGEEKALVYSAEDGTSDVARIAADAVRLDYLGALGPLRSASLRFNAPLILPEDVDVSRGGDRVQTLYQDMVG